MDNRRQSSIGLANEELRRMREAIVRPTRAPLRFVIAGDPTRPVLSFTVPRGALTFLGMAGILVALGVGLIGWGRPARALGALSHALMHDSDSPAIAEVVAEPPSSVQALLPKLEAEAVPEGEHFAVEILNTGHKLNVVLGGPASEPTQQSYRALRHELRCMRSGAESPIDPRLVELLYRIAVSANSSIQIVSAFRAPTRAGESNFHTRGMAADIRVPGLRTSELRDLARSHGARGVGYYPTSQFVHVDVREVPYFWTDTSGHAHNNQNDEDESSSASSRSTAPGGVVPAASSAGSPEEPAGTPPTFADHGSAKQ